MQAMALAEVPGTPVRSFLVVMTSRLEAPQCSLTVRSFPYLLTAQAHFGQRKDEFRRDCKGPARQMALGGAFFQDARAGSECNRDGQGGSEWGARQALQAAPGR